MSPTRSSTLVLGSAALTIVLACAGPSPQSTPTSLRLIDQFAEASLEGSPEPRDGVAAGAAWSFAEEGAEAWEAGQGVERLRLACCRCWRPTRRCGGRGQRSASHCPKIFSKLMENGRASRTACSTASGCWCTT